MKVMGKSSSKICPAEDNVDQKTATNICIRRIGHSSVVFHALRFFFLILLSVEYSNISWAQASESWYTVYSKILC